MRSEYIELFVRNPIQSMEQAEEFIEETEEFLRSEAYSIEKDLENSNIGNGKMGLNFDYFTMFPTYPGSYLAASFLVDCDGVEDKVQDLLAKYARDEYEEFSGKEIGNFGNTNYESKKLKSLVKVSISSPLNKDAKKTMNTNKAGVYRHDPTLNEGPTIVLNKFPNSLDQKINIPRALRPLVDGFSVRDVSFESTLVHELNHAYLADNCSNYEEAQEEEWFRSFDEIFAFFLSNLISGKEAKNLPESLYDRPDIIEWGVSILIAKNDELEGRGKKETGIDFVRDLMINMVERDNPLGVFLNFCLFDHDKKRLNQFKRTLNEVYGSFEEFERYLGSLESQDFQGSREEKKSKIKEIKRIRDSMNLRETDVPRPDDLRKNFLKKILHQAIEGRNPGYYGLRDINKKLTEELTEITEELERKGEILDQERKRFDNDEVRLAFREMEKELSDCIESMESTVEKGTLSEQLSKALEKGFSDLNLGD